MTWMSLVCTLNEQCSGICGEASYRGKRLTLAERGRNRRLKKIKDEDDDQLSKNFRNQISKI